jgi:hypothetical protein
MTRRTVPGQLGYHELALLYRPTDPAALKAEIRRMRSRGLLPRDIATALRLDLAAVVEALRDDEGPPP